MSAGFVIDAAYAKYALDNRSMFLRDYYITLLYFSLINPNEKLSTGLELIKNKDVGRASFLDLSFKLSWSMAKKTLKKSVDAYKSASYHSHSIWSIPKVLFRAICVPMCAMGCFIMLPVRVIYGILDWLSLQAAKSYFIHSDQSHPIERRLERTSYLALGISFLTIPIRLAAGFVEALQEPFHLEEFWYQGGKDAVDAYKRGEISGFVLGLKLLLHTIKVVCTFGAILSITGLVIPFISKGLDTVGKTAHYMFKAKTLIPYNEYILDGPTYALKHTIIGAEAGIGQILGLHYSQVSMNANTEKSIELGYESSCTKFAWVLARLKGLRPVDTLREKGLLEAAARKRAAQQTKMRVV